MRKCERICSAFGWVGRCVGCWAGLAAALGSPPASQTSSARGGGGDSGGGAPELGRTGVAAAQRSQI